MVRIEALDDFLHHSSESLFRVGTEGRHLGHVTGEVMADVSDAFVAFAGSDASYANVNVLLSANDFNSFASSFSRT